MVVYFSARVETKMETEFLFFETLRLYQMVAVVVRCAVVTANAVAVVVVASAHAHA